jgi:hypothetical protein
LTQDPHYDPTLHILVDLREARSGVRGTGALEQVADLIRSTHGGETGPTRIAIVAPTDISFGLGRMFEAFGSDSRCALDVFRDIQAAFRWLEIPQEIAPDLGL